MFLLPVDRARDRFRFHQLLRELLQGELRWRAPDRAVLLHERAAEHLVARGFVAQAIAHFVAAGRLDAAYDLLAAPAWERLDRGDLVAARRWLGSFPPGFIERDPERVLTHVVLLTTSGQVDEAHALLRRTAADGGDARDDPGRAPLRIALRTIVEYIRGDHEECRRSAQECLDLLGDRPLVGAGMDRLTGVLVRLAIDDSDLPEAERWLVQVGDPESPSLVLSTLLPGALEARVAMLAGRLGDAESASRRVIDAAEQHDVRAVIPVGEAHMTLGAVCLETGRLTDAEHHTAIAVGILAEIGITMLEAEARLVAVRLATARFGAAAGLALLAATRTAFGARHVGRHIQARLDAAECRLLLVSGDVPAAQSLLGTIPESTERRLLEARRFLAERRFEDVARALRDLDAGDWPVAAQIEALTLLARTPGSAANEHFRRAAALSVRHQLLHTFLGEGPELLRMARRAQRDTPGSDLAELLANTGTLSLRDARPTFIDPLTDREHALLSLLPTHLTYREIADDMCVSVNTVKTYQKTVFRKLNVSSRSEAVSIAREARMLGTTDEPASLAVHPYRVRR